MKHKHLSRRLVKEHVRPYIKQILIAVSCMVVVAVSTAAFPYLLKPAFDFVFENKDPSSLLLLCFGIIITFIVKGTAGYGESFMMNIIGQKIIFDIQRRLFKHLLLADLQFFTSTHSGEILSRFTNDVNMMRNSVSTTLVGIGKDFLSFIFLAGVMFYRDWHLSFFAFIIFPSAIIPIFLLGRKMKKTTKNIQGELGSFSGYLTQIFQSIRIIRSYGTEQNEIERLNKRTTFILNLMTKTARIKSALHPISECIAGFAIVLVLAYGGFQIIHGEKTTGDLISFLGALLLSYEPLRRLTHLSANMQEGLAAAGRVFEVLDIKPKISDSASPIILNPKIESIEFQDVCFGYNNDNNIIHNINFKVKKGDTIALVGPSGSGKSTIINLISRFYDTTSGEILINGIDLREFTLKSLRQQIAIVTQETVLFDASFFDNISYGKQNALQEEVIQASIAASAHKFIINSPEGYNTIIGENGIRISGGQRQRISIARAILKNAPILLLDEATSSLDTIAEQSVQKAIDKLIKDRTTIIVAHRLSSIVNANMIYVLENGTILESGTHKELIARNSKYRSMWEAQEKKTTN